MEDKEIKITEQLFNQIFEAESKKLVGIIMRRWETITNEEDRKKNVKDLVYEGLRNIRDFIILCSKANPSIHLEKKL